MENKHEFSMITKPKLRNYVMYKTEFKAESYLHSIFSKSDRSLIAKLRCGILKLKQVHRPPKVFGQICAAGVSV